MKKAKLVVPAVNTSEALQNCVEHNTSVFCVKNPLYSRLGAFVPLLADYSIEDYPDKQIAIMKKVRGSNSFDREAYFPVYLPFSWEDWHS